MAKVIYDVKTQSIGNIYVFDIKTVECSDSEVNTVINKDVKNCDNFDRVQDIDFDNRVVRIDFVPKDTAKGQKIQKVYKGQFEEMLARLQTSD